MVKIHARMVELSIFANKKVSWDKQTSQYEQLGALCLFIREPRERRQVHHHVRLPFTPPLLSYRRCRLVNICIGILLVEVGCVGLVHELRLPRRRDFLPLQRRPVHSLEERLHLHLLRVGEPRSQSQRGVSDEQSRDQRGRRRRKQVLLSIPPPSLH